MNKEINDLNKAILNIDASRKNEYGNPKTNDVLYSRWDKRHSLTIGDFYNDFIEPRLPDADVVRRWNKLLIEYSKMDGAIFPIRDGHSDATDDKIKLRRGWLVRVDYDADYKNKFSYMFTDNHLAAYIYKMALDGYCPSNVQEFFDFMTKFKNPADIKWLQGNNIKNDHYKNEKRKFISMPVHFRWIGKSSYPGNTETQKNAYINTDPAPECPFGEYGYKHAHIFGVKKGEYLINNADVKWDDIKLVELGEESNTRQDYQWDDSIKNFVWHRKMKNCAERESLRNVVIAHSLRFLSPMNHFLAPKQGCNKFTTANGDFSLDIAEYERLIQHLIFVRKNDFGSDYDEFKKYALVPNCIAAIDYSADNIDIIYHEDKQGTANKKHEADLNKEAAEKKAKKESANAVKEAEKAAKKAENAGKNAVRESENAAKAVKDARNAAKDAEKTDVKAVKETLKAAVKAAKKTKKAAAKAEEETQKAKQAAEEAKIASKKAVEDDENTAVKAANKAEKAVEEAEKAVEEAEKAVEEAEKAVEEAEKAVEEAEKAVKTVKNTKKLGTTSAKVGTGKSKKDHSEYLFDGNTYKKGKLVLAVIKKYIADGKASDFSNLQKDFPDNLQGGKYGVVRLSINVSDKDKGLIHSKDKRYFVGSAEIILLPSGEEVLVSNQWGTAEKTDKFIEHVKLFGYSITKIK